MTKIFNELGDIFFSPNIYRSRAIISRGLYIFTLFFTAFYNQELLLLETIYVVNKEILKKKNHSKNEHDFS